MKKTIYIFFLLVFCTIVVSGQDSYIVDKIFYELGVGDVYVLKMIDSNQKIRFTAFIKKSKLKNVELAISDTIQGNFKKLSKIKELKHIGFRFNLGNGLYYEDDIIIHPDRTSYEILDSVIVRKNREKK